MKHIVYRYNSYEQHNTKLVEKIWGTEDHVINDPSLYCVKVMTIDPGSQVSLHFHKDKTETFTLVSGVLVVEVITTSDGIKHTEILNKPGCSITLTEEVPHTFYCPPDQEKPTIFIESSTYDNLDDSYRITQSSAKQ